MNSERFLFITWSYASTWKYGLLCHQLGYIGRSRDTQFPRNDPLHTSLLQTTRPPSNVVRAICTVVRVSGVHSEEDILHEKMCGGTNRVFSVLARQGLISTIANPPITRANGCRLALQ